MVCMPTITVNGKQVATLDILPPGTFAWFCGSVVPDGFLKCDGSVISRSQYADLFAAISTTFGAGNGSSTFGLPDLITANRFIRAGNIVGQTQSDAIRNIMGLLAIYGDSYARPYINVGGAFTRTTSTDNAPIMNGASSGPGWTSQIQFNASASVPTDSENRPVNITLMAIIKY